MRILKYLNPDIATKLIIAIIANAIIGLKFPVCGIGVGAGVVSFCGAGAGIALHFAIKCTSDVTGSSKLYFTSFPSSFV